MCSKSRGLSARLVVLGESGEPAVPGALTYTELTAEVATLSFEAVPSSILSGLLYRRHDGLPKPIVPGHGGILLEQLTALALHSTSEPAATAFFWFSTTRVDDVEHVVSGRAVGSPSCSTMAVRVTPTSIRCSPGGRGARDYFGTSAPSCSPARRCG